MRGILIEHKTTPVSEGKKGLRSVGRRNDAKREALFAFGFRAEVGT
jgi:hypothetical protein